MLRMDLERIKKEVKKDPHILDSIPLFYRMVIERLIDEDLRDLDKGVREG